MGLLRLKMEQGAQKSIGLSVKELAELSSKLRNGSIKYARYIGPWSGFYDEGTVYPVKDEKHGFYQVDNLDGEIYFLPKKQLEFVTESEFRKQQL